MQRILWDVRDYIVIPFKCPATIPCTFKEPPTVHNTTDIGSYSNLSEKKQENRTCL